MLRKGSNQDYIKISNKKLILQYIQKHDRISRIDLTRCTGLTKATVTNIVNQLLSECVIHETGFCDTKSGRRPILLEINPSKYSIIGIYWARDFFDTAIADFKGAIYNIERHQFNADDSIEVVIELIIQAVDNLIHRAISPIIGIGVASIGPIDISQLKILSPVEFHNWHNIEIVKTLREKFKVPTFLENDCNASALAEKLLGNFKDIDNFVYLGIENGVGSGVIIDGNLYKGNDGFGVEIGHTTIDINGKQCACGNIGCLELYLKLPYAVEKLKNAIHLHVPNLFYNKITWEKIVENAQNGDTTCINTIMQIVPYLIVGIVNAINIFDPAAIILGHDLVLAEEFILPIIITKAKKHYFSRTNKDVLVHISTFKNKAPINGAIAMVLSNYYGLR